MPRRRKRRVRNDGPPTREEFDAVLDRLSYVEQKAKMGRGISAVLSGEPGVDDSFEWRIAGLAERAIDAETVAGFTPEEIPYLSDGAAPASSPTPTVQGGARFLNVKWDAVANADRVTYEVHLSTTSGFTPDSSSLVGETPGLQYFIHKDALEADLVYDTDYFVKLIAKDADGAAAASSESTAEQLDPNGSDDILAGAITAEKLETLLVVANTLLAGTPGAQRLEFGYGTDESGNQDGFLGIRCYDPDGTLTFQVDAESGEVLLRGDVYFGAGSRLYKSQDIIELGEQTAAAFEEPYLIQSSSGNRGQSATASATWPVDTQPDSYLVAVVTMTDTDLAAPDLSGIADWSLAESFVYEDDFGERAAYIFTRTDGPLTGTYQITLGDTVKWSMCLFEFGGCDTSAAPDASAHSDATSVPTYPTVDGTVEAGTTGAPGQNQGVYFGILYAALASEGTGGNGDDPQEGFSNQLSGFTYIRSWAEHTPVSPSAKIGAYFKPITDGSTASLAADREYTDVLGSFASPHSFSNGGLQIFLRAASAGVATPEADKVRIFAQDIGARSTLRVRDDQGDEASIVLGADDEVWRLEVVTISFDIPDTAAKSGGLASVAGIGNLAVGDYFVILGGEQNNARGFNLRPRLPVSTAGQADIDYFNNDSVNSQNPPAVTLDLLVIHRS